VHHDIIITTRERDCGNTFSLIYLLNANGLRSARLLQRCLHSQTQEQQHFTISEVAADWHELTIPQHIMRPSIAHANRQLDPVCSQQTYHRPNQPHYTFTP